MPPSDEKSRIEELKNSLYSRSAPDVRTRRKLRFTENESEVKKSWERPAEESADTSLNERYEDHSMSFLTKLLIGSFIFCVGAVGLGAYLFFNGSNLISANNIDIAIDGPVSIAGGSPVSFGIRVKNKNNTDLQMADLKVEFPSGATDPKDPSQELKTYREFIGDIPAGGSADKSVNAIIFGEENLQKEIQVTVTYKVKGSTSLFTKTTNYDVLINSSPINVAVTGFKEITSGQEFDIKVALKSNSQQTLKNVLLKADYPFGYTFLSSDLAPLSSNTSWRIGDIPAGASRTIVIHGRLTGEDTDTRAFHFTVGAQSSSDPKSIGTQYMAVEQDMTIQKPFISLDVAVDGDNSSSGDHVGQFNSPERVQINWANNLPVTVSNMQISVKLSGNAYDKTAIQPDLGYFDSANNQIIWSQQTNKELGTVAAGDNGSVSFTVVPKDTGSSANPVVNPTVNVSVNVTGNRTQESNVPQALTSVASRNIKVSSNLSLSGRVVRTKGPFTNSGPIPPKTDQPTTYTVIWTVDNTSNSAANAQVTATLPPYVKWLNVINPTSESVTYDQNTGAVTWNIGNVGTYTQSSSRRREVNFQISFQPGVNQINQTPTLVNQATLTATDGFTGSTLQSQQDYLTTRFSTDPAYREGDETVVK